MYKHYLIILTLFLSMGFMASAQIKSDKVPVVYTGPSADGDAKRDKGDLEGAIVSYTSEIKKIEVEVNRIVKLKDAYKKMSEFDKMNQNQDEVKKNYNSWSKLYYGRAIANIKLSKKEGVQADLDCAIVLDNSMADAYFQRALLVNTKENKENACIDMSRAAALGSEVAKMAFDNNFCWTLAQLHFKDATSNVMIRKFDEAIVDLNMALALCPDSGIYYSKRGQAYEGLQKKDKALEDYSRGIEFSPNNFEAYYRFGLYYFNLDNFEKAFDFFTNSITRNPLNYDAYVFRAQCCERQNKQTSAIYDYGQAISIKPNDSEAYYRRALLEREMKEITKMCNDFARAAQLGNTDAAEFLKECEK